MYHVMYYAVVAARLNHPFFGSVPQGLHTEITRLLLPRLVGRLSGYR